MNKKSQSVICKTPIFDISQKEFEEVSFKPVGIEAPNWVTLIAHTVNPSFKDMDVVMVKQTRWGIEDFTNEFPCGTMESSDYENTSDEIAAAKFAAIREFEEETGIIIPDVDNVNFLGSFNPNPAMFSNTMSVFEWTCPDLDEAFSKREKQNLDENEDCIVYLSSIKDSFTSLCSNAIMCSALFLLKNKHEQ